jgi:hypothetical protein
LVLARELTGQHFALPNLWFETNSHEVCTLRELRRQEIAAGGRLALIRRVSRILGEGPGRVLRSQTLCPHYRICLQDHNIFQKLSLEGDLALRDLLTCVLVHEYVHLVRFQRLEQPYCAGPGEVREEEERVARIARRIVMRQGCARLRDAAARALAEAG